MSGYEFKIRDQAGDLSWVRIQGSGGALGDGLPPSSASTRARVGQNLLRRARAILRHEGGVWIVVRGPRGMIFTPIHAVLQVREIGTKK